MTLLSKELDFIVVRHVFTSVPNGQTLVCAHHEQSTDAFLV